MLPIGIPSSSRERGVVRRLLGQQRLGQGALARRQPAHGSPQGVAALRSATSCSSPAGGVADRWRRRSVGQLPRPASRTRADGLAARGGHEPAGDRGGLGDRPDAHQQPDPCDLHDILDQVGVEPKAPATRRRTGENSSTSSAPGALVAAGGRADEVLGAGSRRGSARAAARESGPVFTVCPSLGSVGARGNGRLRSPAAHRAGAIYPGPGTPYSPDRGGRRPVAAAAGRGCDYSAMDTVSESTVLQLPPDLVCRSTSTSVTSREGDVGDSSWRSSAPGRAGSAADPLIASTRALLSSRKRAGRGRSGRSPRSARSRRRWP